MLLSLTLQVTAIAVGIIVSVVTVETLGAFALPQPMPPIPRAPQPVQLVAVPASHAARPSSGFRIPVRSFVPATRVPTSLPVFTDAPDMLLSQTSVIGDPSGSVAGGLGFQLGLPHAPVPPMSVASAAQHPHSRETKPNLRLGGDVLEAKLVKRVVPEYPQLARQMRLSGTVHLEGVIARDGRVVNLRVISGHPVLIASALDAVRQWVYRPTLLNGETVEVIAPIEVRFILSH